MCADGYTKSGNICKKRNTGLIIGLSVGGFVLLLIIGILISYYLRKKKRDHAIEMKNA